LYAGLHGLAQGLNQVLDAAEALKDEGGFRFVLVGDGPEKRQLVEEAQRRGLTNVRFDSARPAHEIPALLAAADILLVTLKAYIPGAVPSKLYEAMASGRPVILVATGEAADIVREHQAGIAVEPGDKQGLADALRILRADAELRRDLGESGRRAAEQHFDRAKISERFMHELEANRHNEVSDSRRGVPLVIATIRRFLEAERIPEGPGPRTLNRPKTALKTTLNKRSGRKNLPLDSSHMPQTGDR
jgi:hypothetical protein